LLRDSREKFDTVVDCEPSIERLYRGAKEAAETRERRDHTNNIYNVPDDTVSLIDGKRYFHDDDTMTLATLNGTVIGLTEQDVYAAADSLEIIRDAHIYFQKRPRWNASKTALTGLQRVHQLGADGMCMLIKFHLISAGPAIRMKRGWALKRNVDDATVDTRGASTIATNTTFGTRQGGGAVNPHAQESAKDTRERLAQALQNRDLMKSGKFFEIYLYMTKVVLALKFQSDTYCQWESTKNPCPWIHAHIANFRLCLNAWGAMATF
jgi:exocyst complex protein 7